MRSLNHFLPHFLLGAEICYFFIGCLTIHWVGSSINNVSKFSAIEKRNNAGKYDVGLQNEIQVTKSFNLMNLMQSPVLLPAFNDFKAATFVRKSFSPYTKLICFEIRCKSKTTSLSAKRPVLKILNQFRRICNPIPPRGLAISCDIIGDERSRVNPRIKNS